VLYSLKIPAPSGAVLLGGNMDNLMNELLDKIKNMTRHDFTEGEHDQCDWGDYVDIDEVLEIVESFFEAGKEQIASEPNNLKPCPFCGVFVDAKTWWDDLSQHDKRCILHNRRVTHWQPLPEPPEDV